MLTLHLNNRFLQVARLATVFLAGIRTDLFKIHIVHIRRVSAGETHRFVVEPVPWTPLLDILPTTFTLIATPIPPAVTPTLIMLYLA